MCLKRITAIILSVAVLFSFMVIPAIAENNKVNYEKFSFLSALDIVSVNADNAQNTVTRAELAHILAKTFNVALEKGSNFMNYRDVNENTPYLGSIDAMSGMGAFSGSDGFFYPNRNAKVEEAVKVMVTAMGYEFRAASRGGYPNGYFAALPDLVKGVSMSVGKDITLLEVAQMVYNAFEIRFPEEGYIGGSLAEIHKIYEGEGIVTGNYITRLAENTGTGSGEVEINGEHIMRTGSTNAANLLGRKIKYRYKADTNGSDMLLLSAEVKANVKTVVIESKDIQKFDNYTYLYYDNYSLKSAKIENSANILYNYGSITEPFNKYVPDYGRITLVDNGNGFEFVLIEDYTVGIVESVGKESIYTKNGVYIPVNADESEKFRIVDKNGTSVNIDDLKEWDTLIVEERQDKGFYTLIYSDDRKQGIISANGEEKVKTFFQIGEEQYTVPTDKIYMRNPSEIVLGDEYILYLDAFGNISAVAKSDNEGLQYAYMTAAAPSSKILSSTVEVKLFTKNNKFEVFETNKKIKFNNDKITAGEFLSRLLGGEELKPQLVRYELDEKGKLAALETASPQNNSLAPIATEGFRLLASGTYSSRANSSWFSGAAMYNDGAYVFVVPSDITSEDDFMYKTTSYFPDSGSYEIKTYADNSNRIISEAIVVVQNINKKTMQKRLLLINKVCHETTPEGDMKCKIYGMQSGKEVEFFVSENAQSFRVASLSNLENEGTAFNPATLASGDIVKIAVNKYGEIELIQPFYDESEAKYLLISAEPKDDAEPVIANPSNRSYVASYRYAYGAVYEKEGAGLLLVKGGTAPSQITSYSDLELLSTVGGSIYRYDSEEKCFKKVTIADIVTFRNHNTEYDNAITILEDGFTREIILFSNAG